MAEGGSFCHRMRRHMNRCFHWPLLACRLGQSPFDVLRTKEKMADTYKPTDNSEVSQNQNLNKNQKATTATTHTTTNTKDNKTMARSNNIQRFIQQEVNNNQVRT